MDRLTVVTPPASEPVSLATARQHLRIPLGFTDDDALIGGLISAARAICETEVRQAFLTQTVRLDLDYWPNATGGYLNRLNRQMAGYGVFPGLPTASAPIDLFRPPVQSIVSVRYYDVAGTLQTISPSLYQFDAGIPSRLYPVYTRVWPTTQPRNGAIQITYVVGYGDTAASLPAAILGTVSAAMLLGIASLYEHRGDDGAAWPIDTMQAVLAAIDHGSYA